MNTRISSHFETFYREINILPESFSVTIGTLKDCESLQHLCVALIRGNFKYQLLTLPLSLNTVKLNQTELIFQFLLGVDALSSLSLFLVIVSEIWTSCTTYKLTPICWATTIC